MTTLKQLALDTRLLEKKCDKLTKEIVRWRDGLQCYCGSREMPQTGHLIGRRNKGVRWHLGNVSTQCASCNYKHNLPQYSFRFYAWHSLRFGSLAQRYLSALADEWEKKPLAGIEYYTFVHSELDRLEGVFEKTERYSSYDDELLVNLNFYGDMPISLPLGAPVLSFNQIRKMEKRHANK